MATDDDKTISNHDRNARVVSRLHRDIRYEFCEKWEATRWR